jgi:hypothetical protein
LLLWHGNFSEAVLFVPMQQSWRFSGHNKYDSAVSMVSLEQ